jgi:hypothetical protein
MFCRPRSAAPCIKAIEFYAISSVVSYFNSNLKIFIRLSSSTLWTWYGPAKDPGTIFVTQRKIIRIRKSMMTGLRVTSSSSYTKYFLGIIF